jgi:hypothetical protein
MESCSNQKSVEQIKIYFILGFFKVDNICLDDQVVASYPRRLEAVIAAKGSSTKYRVKGLNTYVNVIFKLKCF